jgi:hypothetical protein
MAVMEIRLEEPDVQREIITHIKESIDTNPSALACVMGPTINELISDANIPDKIKQNITDQFSNFLAAHPIEAQLKAAIEEFISSAISETYGSEYLRNIIEGFISTDQFKERMIAILNEHLDTADIEAKVNEEVESRVESEMQHVDVSEAVNEIVQSDLDNNYSREIESGIEAGIEHYCDSNDFSDKVDDRIDDIIKDKIDEDTINDALESSVRSNLATIVVEEIKNQFKTSDEVLQLIKDIVSEQTPSQPSIVTSENEQVYDVVIRCKPAILQSLSTFITSTMGDAIHIESSKLRGATDHAS